MEDGWARDLEIRETQNAITIGPGAKRLTLANIRITHSGAHSGSAAPADFSLQGTQILLDRCRVTGEGTWPVVAEQEAIGPLVVLNFAADHGGVAPHQPWATGLLVDGGAFPGAPRAQAGRGFSLSRHGGFGPGMEHRVGGGMERRSHRLCWCSSRPAR